MIVDGYSKLEVFWKRHSRARTPLLRWFDTVTKVNWRSLQEIRQTFRHADAVYDCTVFNIHGNDYRLISKIDFEAQAVDVRFVLTHPEYDRGSWKNDCR
ncbi:MAG TPA: type II toxin-antitoxin system HigB family toxin [Blastocatellia bacterium]|nr:type II toxin-antitoxin system HigB family toxin [Blastocatellia bacterium]